MRAFHRWTGWAPSWQDIEEMPDHLVEAAGALVLAEQLAAEHDRVMGDIKAANN
jgi:hypothetical protein